MRVLAGRRRYQPISARPWEVLSTPRLRPRTLLADPDRLQSKTAVCFRSSASGPFGIGWRRVLSESRSLAAVWQRVPASDSPHWRMRSAEPARLPPAVSITGALSRLQCRHTAVQWQPRDPDWYPGTARPAARR